MPPSSSNPNAAFVPPPGWVPPGGRPAVEVAAVAPPTSAPRQPTGARQVAVIQFTQMSADLTAADVAILQRVADIQRSSGGRVRIVAHAAEDAFGSSVAVLSQGNLDMSRRRALAVASQLIRLGVPRERIVAEAASDAEPIYDPTTPRGVAANRRADITVEF
ncbi:MAG: OmpA family protein [Reyranellaceae bacterium]